MFAGAPGSVAFPRQETVDAVFEGGVNVPEGLTVYV